MNKNFKYSGKPHISLTAFQKAALSRFKDKIKQDVYRFEDVPCLCGAAEDAVISETDRYGLRVSIVICTSCGLVRMNPRLDANSLERFYREEYRDVYMGPEYGSMDNYFQGTIRRGEGIASTIDMYASGLDWRSAAVLEVGCSTGGILVPFLRRGARVRGYDYDARYLDYGMKKFPKLDLRIGGVEDLTSDTGCYDVIIFNHVLEHLPHPWHAVQLAGDRLSPQGIIYVSVPGLRNPEFYFSPTKSILGGFHIAHLYYFTSFTLVQAIAGFEPLFVDESVCSVIRKAASLEKRRFVPGSAECESTVTYIQKYESRVIARFCRSAAPVLHSFCSHASIALKKTMRRVLEAVKYRFFAFVTTCKCLNREYRWLYQNRWLRMDANIPLNDKRRRDFHVDRYEFAVEFLRNQLGEKSLILDAACGTGYGSDILKQCRPARLIGVDICADAVAYARKHYGGEVCDFICADVTRFDGMAPQLFDAVVSFETIEHLEKPIVFLEKIHGLLKPGGILIISTPNKWGLTKDHKVDYDYGCFKKDLEIFFAIDKMFIQNSGCMDLWINRGAPRRLLPDEPGIRDTAECFVAVAHKK